MEFTWKFPIILLQLSWTIAHPARPLPPASSDWVNPYEPEAIDKHVNNYLMPLPLSQGDPLTLSSRPNSFQPKDLNHIIDLSELIKYLPANLLTKKIKLGGKSGNKLVEITAVKPKSKLAPKAPLAILLATNPKNKGGVDFIDSIVNERANGRGSKQAEQLKANAHDINVVVETKLGEDPKEEQLIRKAADSSEEITQQFLTEAEIQNVFKKALEDTDWKEHQKDLVLSKLNNAKEITEDANSRKTDNGNEDKENNDLQNKNENKQDDLVEAERNENEKSDSKILKENDNEEQHDNLDQVNEDEKKGEVQKEVQEEVQLDESKENQEFEHGILTNVNNEYKTKSAEEHKIEYNEHDQQENQVEDNENEKTANDVKETKHHHHFHHGVINKDSHEQGGTDYKEYVAINEGFHNVVEHDQDSNEKKVIDNVYQTEQDDHTEKDYNARRNDIYDYDNKYDTRFPAEREASNILTENFINQLGQEIADAQKNQDILTSDDAMLSKLQIALTKDQNVEDEIGAKPGSNECSPAEMTRSAKPSDFIKKSDHNDSHGNKSYNLSFHFNK